MRPGLLLASLALALTGLHAAATWVLLGGLSGAAFAANVALLAVEALLCAFAALLFASLREARLPPPGPVPEGAVDVLVPLRNEDPRVLRETLRAAKAMRAPPGGFRVLALDDSDAPRAEDISRVCREERVEVLRRPERRGYKAGALNDALAATRAPFVAVLDVDHRPEPAFLLETMSRFAPGVAFVQGIIEWRNEDSLLRRLAGLLQHQFYHNVQMEKAARERVVFTGSAAVFRREALDAVGGFPEETLVEDFDLTLLLTNAGWRGRLSPHVAARGLLPWSAGDLARQLWRWSHGTTEAVKLRMGPTLRARAAPLAPRLELLADGCAYLAGGAFVLAALLLVGMAFTNLPVARPLGGWGVLLAPVTVALAHLGGAALALRRRGRGSLLVLPLYHLVSLAFTPVLLVSALAAWLGIGRRFEGRVGKLARPSRGRGVVVGVSIAALLGGVALVAALGGGLAPPAAGWAGLLGASFAATVALAVSGEGSARPDLGNH